MLTFSALCLSLALILISYVQLIRWKNQFDSSLHKQQHTSLYLHRSFLQPGCSFKGQNSATPRNLATNPANISTKKTSLQSQPFFLRQVPLVFAHQEQVKH